MADIPLRRWHASITYNDGSNHEISTQILDLSWNMIFNREQASADYRRLPELTVEGKVVINISIRGALYDGVISLLAAGTTTGNALAETTTATAFSLDVDYVGPDGTGSQRCRAQFTNCVFMSMEVYSDKDSILWNGEIQARGITITNV